jgi:hypothetical protein
VKISHKEYLAYFSRFTKMERIPRFEKTESRFLRVVHGRPCAFCSSILAADMYDKRERHVQGRALARRSLFVCSISFLK